MTLSATILVGDALARLRELPDASVHCCVTSPPYFALRSYLPDGHPDKALEIGLQDTPAAYVARLVEVFRQVRRVLRPDAVIFCNLGDSWGAGKQLQGIPWRVAFALQEDGWVLRSEIIFAKPAPMPESVRDRPTKAHEQVFLLAARPRYYWDAEAIAEEGSGLLGGACVGKVGSNGPGSRRLTDKENAAMRGGTRNVRSVWTISPTPLKLAHFATMPEGLAERCLLAGTSARGVCPACGAPWVRVVEREADNTGYPNGPGGKKSRSNSDRGETSHPGTMYDVARWKTTTTGWRPTCTCPAADPAPAVVLDPFGGAMTTALVAARLGRSSVSVELNPAYADMGARRVRGELGLVCQVEVRT